MKKYIAYILAVVVIIVTMVTLPTNGQATWQDGLALRQQEVHAAANLLRELGFSDKDPSIQSLSREWWRCESCKQAEYLGEYIVTGYDVWCEHCQGRWVGQTASGKDPAIGYTVAMCDAFPFGTLIYIDGLGIFEVQDRGVGPGRIDVACSDHKSCDALTGKYDVWVISYPN